MRKISLRLLSLAAALALFLSAGLTLIAWLMTESHPRLDLPVASHASKPLPAELRDRLKGGSFGHGQEKRFILNGEDLNAICRTTLRRRGLEGQCRFNVEGDSLIGEASIRLKGWLEDRYLNIDVLLKGDELQGLDIPYLSIGRLRLTSPVELHLARLIVFLPPLHRLEMLRAHMVKDVRIKDSRIIVILNWDRKVLSELRNLVAETADQERIRIYLARLSEAINKDPNQRSIKLGELTRSLFDLARTRSRENRRPIEENRALILVLSAYANGKDLSDLAGEHADLPKRNVLLNRRIDTARHFLAAALLSMSGQSTLVEMIGLAKELQDTHDGSGFSFIDLAADEAGAAFGKASISSKARALKIQEILSASEDESQIIPTLRDLPESMHTREFEEKFQNVGSAQYEDLRKEIKKRIRTLPIYQSP